MFLCVDAGGHAWLIVDMIPRFVQKSWNSFHQTKLELKATENKHKHTDQSQRAQSPKTIRYNIAYLQNSNLVGKYEEDAQGKSITHYYVTFLYMYRMHRTES